VSSADGVHGRPFVKGNGGRPTGSKNKASVLAAALLEGDREALLRKGLELAKAGDSQMLKFFLNRILPRERPITIDLPAMETADDAVEVLAAIMAAACTGRITPSEAGNLAALVNSYARAIDNADLVKRMDALEARINGAEHAPDSN
jgi:hypothetical protein